MKGCGELVEGLKLVPRKSESFRLLSLCAFGVFVFLVKGGIATLLGSSVGFVFGPEYMNLHLNLRYRVLVL